MTRGNGASFAEVEAAGGYNVIMADPAWQFDSGKVNGAAANHYETMSLSDLATLPVKHLAAEDSVLFTWVTSSHLVERAPQIHAIQVAWGFRPVTVAFVWVKLNPVAKTPMFGTGRWTRPSVEMCLIAVRGRPLRLRASGSVRQLLEAAEEGHAVGPLDEAFDEGPEVIRSVREGHSRKPAEVRTRIETLMGDVPRIELFARERHDGWDAWGNEVPGGNDVEMETVK